MSTPRSSKVIIESHTARAAYMDTFDLTQWYSLSKLVKLSNVAFKPFIKTSVDMATVLSALCSVTNNLLMFRRSESLFDNEWAMNKRITSLSFSLFNLSSLMSSKLWKKMLNFNFMRWHSSWNVYLYSCSLLKHYSQAYSLHSYDFHSKICQQLRWVFS